MKELQPTSIPKVHLLDAGLKGVGQYTAVYLLATQEPAIVDTAFSYSVPKILSGLAELGIAPQELRYIVLTHIHMDHAGGAGVLAQACPNARIVVHESGAKFLAEPDKLVQSVKRAVGALFDRYGEMAPIPMERMDTVRGGESLALEYGFTLRFVYAPGHAPHQYCPFIQEYGGLFVADACGIYRKQVNQMSPTTAPPAFLLGESLETLNALKALQPKTLLFPHYGAYDEPQLLDRYADHLTRWVAEVEHTYDTMQDEEAVVHHFVRKLGPTFRRYYDTEMGEQEIEMNTRGVLLYLKRQRLG